MENLSLVILHWLYIFHHHLFWLGLLNGAFPLAFNADDDSKMKFPYLAAAVLSVIPFGSYFFIPHLASHNGMNVQPSLFFLGLWVVCAVASYAGAFWWLRVGVQKAEVVKKKLTRSSRLERNKKTDIRDIDKFLPSDKQRFDPHSHIDYDKGYFIGMSEEDKPIYIRPGDWNTSHTLLTGRTRSGKGVAAQIIGTQSIQSKELFVVLDPKCDNWMPHIYKEACEKAGQPYVFLDLRQSAHAQINMFEGCDAEVIENMLIAAFGLAPKGDNADAYRTMDRKAARQAAKYIADNPGVTPREVLDVLGAQWRDSSEGLPAAIFAEMMSEMAELNAVNRKSGGIDIKKLAQTGGCLYVLGDMMNPRIIMMQRMILIRLLMLAKNRQQTDDMKIIRVFADEFRVHISRPFIVSLGAAAGWKLLVILAFQSFEDLRDCPADLDADMVKGAAIENCAIQLSYRIKDAATAEVLAAATGTILVDVEGRQIDKNIALSETIEGDRRISQGDRFLIDVNMITSLPVPDIDKKTIGCGVLVGASKLAQFCFTSPILVKRNQAAIMPTTPAPAKEDEVETTVDKLMNLEVIDAPVAPVIAAKPVKPVQSFDLPLLD